MGQPAAKMGDQVVAVDMHIVMVPSPGGPVPTPLPHPFAGIAPRPEPQRHDRGHAGRDLGSTAVNMPPHIPTRRRPFQKPPTNQGTIMTGSLTVMINGKPAARIGDPVLTCNDPSTCRSAQSSAPARS